MHREKKKQTAPKVRAERRLEIEFEILTIVGAAGLIRYSSMQRRIAAPRTAVWSRTESLLKRHKLAWKRGKLCLYSQQDLV